MSDPVTREELLQVMMAVEHRLRNTFDTTNAKPSDYCFHFGLLGRKAFPQDMLDVFPGPGTLSADGTWGTWEPGADDEPSVHLAWTPGDQVKDRPMAFQLSAFLVALMKFEDSIESIRLVDYCLVTAASNWEHQVGVILLDHLCTPVPKYISL